MPVARSIRPLPRRSVNIQHLTKEAAAKGFDPTRSLSYNNANTNSATAAFMNYKTSQASGDDYQMMRRQR